MKQGEGGGLLLPIVGGEGVARGCGSSPHYEGRLRDESTAALLLLQTELPHPPYITTHTHAHTHARCMHQ